MKVSIVECNSYDESQVRGAIEKSLENINFEIKDNQKVMIKPNVLGQHKPEDHVTTHPAIVDAVVKIFKKKNCKVIIGESSGFYKEGGTKKALEMSGMKKVAEDNDIELVNLETKPILKIEDKDAIVYKNPHITSLIKEVDLIVNLPKLKTHTLMKYTGAVKNLFGCIPGGKKQQLHAFAQRPDKFGQLLVDIYQNIKPELNIMDAVIGLEGNGPGSAGLPKKTGLIISSKNAPALDIVASDIIGYNPMDIYTNMYCTKRKLVNKEEIEIIGKKPTINYKKPINVSNVPSWLTNWFMSQAVMNPYAIKKKCIKCGICKGICPVDAIKMDPYPKIDKNKCIHCYCCHETCPKAAMDLKGSGLFAAVKKIKNIIEGK
jgi:uncharacterized protein (DUF362 family)/NAD-dependent dihydropyrimidine dehydrogenase PreA subunit